MRGQEINWNLHNKLYFTETITFISVLGLEKLPMAKEPTFFLSPN